MKTSTSKPRFGYLVSSEGIIPSLAIETTYKEWIKSQEYSIDQFHRELTIALWKGGILHLIMDGKRRRHYYPW